MSGIIPPLGLRHAHGAEGPSVRPPTVEVDSFGPPPVDDDEGDIELDTTQTDTVTALGPVVRPSARDIDASEVMPRDSGGASSSGEGGVVRGAVSSEECPREYALRLAYNPDGQVPSSVVEASVAPSAADASSVSVQVPLADLPQ